MRYVAFIISAILALVPTFTWASSQPLFPKSDYPAGSEIVYLDNVPSIVVDCRMMFNCASGEPLLHSQEQDYFHRTSGQTQVAQYNNSHGGIAWVSALNLYENDAFATAVMSDLVNTTTNVGKQKFVTEPVSSPTSTISIVKLKYWSSTFSITVIGLRKGKTEIELGVSYQNANRKTAVKYLTKQVSDAVAILGVQP